MAQLWVKRLLLVFFGIALGATLLEVGLRLGRVALHQIGYRATRPEVGDRDGRVILCVGDSHTYGTSIPREDAYPAQLQVYLNRVDPEGRYTVVNRGVPGMNSAQVAEVLPSWLRRYGPDFVVLWVGANNWWNREDPAGIRTLGSQGWLDRVLSRSRLYWFWLNFRVHSRLVEASEDADAFMAATSKKSQAWLYADPLSESEMLAATRGDLVFTARTLEGWGRGDWILVTYPQSHPMLSVGVKLHAEAANEVGRRHGVGVVDTREDLERARSEHPQAALVCSPPLPDDKECLFVNAMGPHPTGLVFRFIAESVGERILSKLGCAGPCSFDPSKDPR